MNSKNHASGKCVYHTDANAGFTGFYERVSYEHPTKKFSPAFGPIFDYHLFIKYGDKVYMEVKGVGEVVISFAELKKNKYWKHYYDLSLLLANDENTLTQELKYSSDYADVQIYEEPRFWSIDTAFIEYNVDTETSTVRNSEETSTCYYKINPFDLENMDYTSSKDLDIFLRNYMMRSEIKNKVFDTRYSIYNRIVVDYALQKVEDYDYEEIAADNKRYYAELAATSAT
uniref:Uncharacterized protein n=1 Tax=viral metagenome TaxID=1070528 RepID=A0A6C0LHZ6_9ZZZZ